MAALCGLASIVAPTVAAPIAPDTRIDHVTVYADRADVVRVAEEVGLQAGANRVLFPALPPGVDPGSVRAVGSGSVGVRIVNVDVRRENLEAVDDTPEARRLRGEAEDVEREMRARRAKKEGLEVAHAFLESLRIRQALEDGERLAGSGLDPERVSATLGFLAESVGANRLEAAELDVQLAKLQERRDAIERELAARRPRPGQSPWTAEVELDAERPGRVAVSLAYSVSGVSWAPTYDVIVSDDLRSIAIVYSADVQQRTGEDWNHAAITLSSAQPALGAEVPALEPWWLVLPRPASEAELPKQAGVVQLGDQFFVRGGRSEEVRTVVDGMPVANAFRAVHARVAGVFATSFEVPVRQDLPSDGRSRRLRIGSVEVTGEVRHRCVPRLSPHVFLVASVTNSSEMPLLEGGSRVIVGGQFLGKGRLPDIAPGQEFDLSLGVDQAVSVKRQRVRHEREAVGDRVRLELGYRTEITNHRREPIRLELRDQVPLSPDGDVRVRLRDVTPGPDAEPDRDGFLSWFLEIAPGGEQSVEMEYEVRSPVDKAPVNADR